MTKSVKVLSDYTPANEPNTLSIIKDNQGDIHIHLYRGNDDERGVRIANNGTRYSPKVRQAFYDLITVLEEEMQTTKNNELKSLI
ncbi:hypothetical protein CVD28_00560 [Bacillus sp. M6-12]|uniref:hypothetical protein n=1 Tax=Bacillus sp. M6-12 TaxID=2054166 RepID=UPI000C78DEE1|nr:hypothetical protein [Bacillus sp. M6-12]PLS18926.1 hypothetical protein CVD28_00560 [Bacillus sp. M6-12]